MSPLWPLCWIWFFLMTWVSGNISMEGRSLQSKTGLQVTAKDSTLLDSPPAASGLRGYLPKYRSGSRIGYLIKRGGSHSGYCVLCPSVAETAIHPFLECPFVCNRSFVPLPSYLIRLAIPQYQSILKISDFTRPLPATAPATTQYLWHAGMQFGLHETCGPDQMKEEFARESRIIGSTSGVRPTVDVLQDKRLACLLVAARGNILVFNFIILCFNGC